MSSVNNLLNDPMRIRRTSSRFRTNILTLTSSAVVRKPSTQQSKQQHVTREEADEKREAHVSSESDAQNNSANSTPDQTPSYSNSASIHNPNPSASFAPQSSEPSASASTSASGPPCTAPPPLTTFPAPEILAPVGTDPSVKPPPLPYSFTVAYAILRDTDGRDKLLKCIQYGSRLVKWLMLNYPKCAFLCMSVLTRLMALLQRFSHVRQISSGIPEALAATNNQPITTATATATTIITSATPMTENFTAATTRSPTSDTFEIASSNNSLPLPSVEALQYYTPNQLSAFHETLVNAHIKSILSYIDHLSGHISSARRVIRLMKWMYTIPILHKNYCKWRMECQRILTEYSNEEHSSQQPNKQERQLKHNHSSESVEECATSPAPTDCLAHGPNADVSVCPSTCLGRPNVLARIPSPLQLSQQPPSSPLHSLFRLDSSTSRFLLLHLPWVSTIEVCNSALAVFTDVCDDCEWLARFQLLPQRLGVKMGRLSVICWFVTCVVDLLLTLRVLRIQHRLLSQQLRELSRIRKQHRQVTATLAQMRSQRQQDQAKAKDNQRRPEDSSVESSAQPSTVNTPCALHNANSVTFPASTLTEEQLAVPDLISDSKSMTRSSLQRLETRYSVNETTAASKQQKLLIVAESTLRQHTDILKDDIGILRDSVHNSLVNFCKFLSDLGVSLPGVMQQNAVHDALIQLSGLTSGAVGLYKLVVLVPIPK